MNMSPPEFQRKHIECYISIEMVIVYNLRRMQDNSSWLQGNDTLDLQKVLTSHVII